jgi:hypothetical protein
LATSKSLGVLTENLALSRSIAVRNSCQIYVSIGICSHQLKQIIAATTLLISWRTFCTTSSGVASEKVRKRVQQNEESIKEGTSAYAAPVLAKEPP